ncbi:class I SAM-dependent methyltransferase [Nostoc sp. CHAB 5844]|nr:class I SAM-dependent methyltransferase [Nostoc sp. CHAB 5844]
MKALFHKSKNSFLRFYLSIGSSKACPLCGWTGHSFIKRCYPYKPAPTYICPNCGSSERHRFSYLALKDKLVNKYAECLHFAPEKFIEPWLRSISEKYLSVDLCSPNAMQQMDIINLQLPDNSFSLIWCSHVLEHIDNDKKAMSELFRVLRPSGMAVIMVPIYGDSTYEDPELKTPEERLRHFKQEDHVRLYGLDISNRLENVGFQVDMISTSNLSADVKSRYIIEYPSTKEIFLCSKI